MRNGTSKTRGALCLVALAAWAFTRLRARITTRESAAPRPATTAKPRPANVGAPSLSFGASNRKKARNSKYMARLGIAGLVAALIGVPGANFGWDLIARGLADDSVQAASGDLSGVTTSESAAGMLRFRGNLFKNRPTPSPEATETEAAAETPVAEPEPVVEEAPAAPAGSITAILHAAAAEFGLDPGYLVAVASCESGLDPGAVNPAGYHGLFQFSESTWASYGYGSIYDPTAQGRTAARMLAAGMASHWPNCA